MAKAAPPEGYDDNPEWTDADFARGRPAGEILPPDALTALVRKGGRPKGSGKEQVAVRIDKDVLAKLRAGGPGWQTRINDILRKAVA